MYVHWTSCVTSVKSLFGSTLPNVGTLANIVKKLRARTLIKTDMRLQTTKEVLNGITPIKYNLWSGYYKNKIQELRKKEVSLLTKIFITFHTEAIISSSIINACWYIIVIILISSKIHSNIGTLFLIFNTLQTLRPDLQYFMPYGIHDIAKIVTASTRIGNFLRETNLLLATPKVKTELSTNTPLSHVTPYTFINFEYSPGITAITGPLGSGKSLLLKTIGKEHGCFEQSEKDLTSFSYASQEPWLFPSTIRRNILFGNSYDHRRYMKVLTACALIEEIQSLKDGDLTVVTDRGANLSKGQQARVNLARAVYKDCDVYLIDDCLSHLDVLVADFVFTGCFRNFFKNKIVIMVSQNMLQIDNFVDRIVTLDGGVIKSDTLGKQTFSRYKSKNDFKLMENELKLEEKDLEEAITETTPLTGNSETGKNIYTEIKAKGKVSVDVYKKYLKEFGGFYVFSFIFLFTTFVQVLKTFINKLETDWISSEQIIFHNSTNMKTYDEALKNRQRMFYILPVLIIALTVLYILNTILFGIFARKASISIHNLLLSKVINSSAEFFNRHFTGDILNRFSDDMLYLDELVPKSFNDVLKYLAETAAVIILAATVNAYFLVACVVFGVIIIIIRFIYLRTGRALKRLEFLTRSPLLGHINATVEGLATVRIFKNQSMQCEEFDRYQDLHISSSYMYITCNKAFQFVIDASGSCFTAVAIILFLVLDEEMSSKHVSFALVQVMRFIITQFVLCRTLSTLESEMTTVERILQYTQQKQENQNGFDVDNWPSESGIKFENVYLAYNENDYVLSNLNFVVKPNTKLAIVGRTASGKSSLVSTLLRLYEIEGKIYIDNVDIATLPLNLLRSKISVVSEEPTLFSGTVRENIDPSKQISDEEIWNALKTVRLTTIFKSLEDKIDYQNTNLSTGQKQLICLCRVLVRNNKIVILDEVTAAVDSETELLIHQIISNNFTDCSVIIITHKLRHILEYDKILVLDRGVVVEFDRPSRLLENKKGRFYKMYKQNE